ncbi:MAG: hypothetical protein JO147_01800 [Actinobacteria bacterium]|nr:hypothetical protein [Actinomycetota bacterium]
MQLDRFVEQVQEQLSSAAALGDDRAQQIASTLVHAAAPAVRLAVLGAVAAAADELTAALLDVPGAPRVTVRLDADGVHIATASTATPPAAPRADDGDISARISLRLSESLKGEIDSAATRAGISVNTWLMQAATAALSAAPERPPRASTQRVTGWING